MNASWINRWAEGLGTFQPRVQLKSQLPRHRQVGPLTGGYNDPVKRSQRGRTIGSSSSHGDCAIADIDAVSGKPGNEFEPPAFYK